MIALFGVLCAIHGQAYCFSCFRLKLNCMQSLDNSRISALNFTVALGYENLKSCSTKCEALVWLNSLTRLGILWQKSCSCLHVLFIWFAEYLAIVLIHLCTCMHFLSNRLLLCAVINFFPTRVHLSILDADNSQQVAAPCNGHILPPFGSLQLEESSEALWGNIDTVLRSGLSYTSQVSLERRDCRENLLPARQN